MKRPHPGHRRRRSAEARLPVPPRRALRREAALLLRPGARARSEDLRRCRRTSKRHAAARAAELREAEEQKWLLEAVKAYIGATKFKKYERMDEVLFKLAFLLTSVKKEDQAREFFLPPDQGLPELEVHPGRVPVVRRVLLRQGRDGQRPQVLREGRAVPEVQRLPVRRLQKGLVLRQPGRLQDRARDLRRRRPHGDRGQGQRQQRAEAGARSRKPRRTSSRPTRTSAVRTRPGSSSSAPAATSRRR